MNEQYISIALGGILILIIFLIALVIIVSRIIYQQLSLIRDGKQFIPKGNLVDIGETKIHIHAEGKANPTVIFDCGHGVSLASSDWSLVHPEISKVARTIVYDRAGMGLSDKSKKPRTSEQIVEELHALLVNTEEQPPYILVGHSLGALNVCLFANEYPEKVAGVVLVDGGSVNFYKNYFKTPTLMVMIFMISSSIILNKLGIFRVLGKMGLIPHINERKRMLSDTYSQLDEAFFTNIILILQCYKKPDSYLQVLSNWVKFIQSETFP